MSLTDIFLRWVGYWIGLFSNLVAICTLGFFNPWWEFHYASWRIRRGWDLHSEKQEVRRDGRSKV